MQNNMIYQSTSLFLEDCLRRSSLDLLCVGDEEAGEPESHIDLPDIKLGVPALSTTRLLQQMRRQIAPSINYA